MGEEVRSLPLEEAAKKSVVAVNKLSENIKVPRRIRELKAGITESDFPEMATSAMKVTRPLENNPRKLTEEDAMAIYKLAL